MKFDKHGIAKIPKRKLSYNDRIILMNIHYSRANQRIMQNTINALTNLNNTESIRLEPK